MRPILRQTLYVHGYLRVRGRGLLIGTLAMVLFCSVAILRSTLFCHACGCCGRAVNLNSGYSGRGPRDSQDLWRCRDCWVDLYARGMQKGSGLGRPPASVGSSRRGADVFALGPSHFERKALTVARYPWKEVEGDVLEVGGGLHHKQHVLGVASIPVYNQITLHLLRRAYSSYGQVVWCVSNWFFGNKDVDRLRALRTARASQELFLWSDFYAGNVRRELITPENNDLLVDHSLRCIDFILDEMPHIKLLFWCLAKRTFNQQGRSTQIPVHGQYEALLSRYPDHTLDVLKYHDKDSFDRVCCQDRSGHPTLTGYKTISGLLESAC